LIHPPFTYDFNDPFGDNDRTKPFVTKLLAKGNGQCISMPLLYLILAEELNAKAWLALAPEHSFIVFKDSINGHSYNFETTNGHITSDNWVMASGYINVNALRNKTYLDTMSRNALIARCMAELYNEYVEKLGFDEFAAKLIDNIIEINPKGVEGYLLKANLLTKVLTREANRRGIVSKKEFSNYPDIYNIYQQLTALQNLIVEKGYATIPKDEYEAWRSSTGGNRLNTMKNKNGKN
jgi:hypothetical protein